MASPVEKKADRIAHKKQKEKKNNITFGCVERGGCFALKPYKMIAISREKNNILKVNLKNPISLKKRLVFCRNLMNSSSPEVTIIASAA